MRVMLAIIVMAVSLAHLIAAAADIEARLYMARLMWEAGQ